MMGGPLHRAAGTLAAMADRRWVNPPHLRSVDREPGERHATWVELFFDLVFVVAVAQLSHLISNDPSAKSFLHYALLFAPVWFIWVGFTVYADRFDTDDVPHRLAVLVGMVVIAALAVHVDDAFSGGSIPFALCSIFARAILVAMNVRAMRAVPAARDFIAFYVRGWSAGLLLWVVSLAVPEPGRYVVWGVAVLVEVATPLVAERRVGTIPLHVSHIGERFGLFTIIVLGESMVSVTAGIAEVDFDLANSVIAVGAFALAASLAWVYFDRLGTDLVGTTGYVYAHFVVYLGLAAVGPGTLLAIEAADDSALPAGARAALCGGVAVYLLGLCLVAAPTRGSPSGRRRIAARCVAAGAAVAIAFLGAAIAPVATVLLLAGVAVGDLVYELVAGGDPSESSLSPFDLAEDA
jgi:low temperature requirement protein LtrA